MRGSGFIVLWAMLTGLLWGASPTMAGPSPDTPLLPADGATIHLELEEAWRLALARSPRVAAALARVTQAHEEAEVVAAPARPRATMTGFREQTRTTPGPPIVLSTFGMRPGVAGALEERPFQTEGFEYGSSQVHLEVRQLLFDGGQLAARIASARAQEGQSQALLGSVVRDLRRDLELAWLDALQARSRLELAREAEILAREQRRMTEVRFQEGTAARADVVFAQVPVAQAERDRVQVENSGALAQASLNRLLGLPLGTPLTLAETEALPRRVGTPEEAEERAGRVRPEVVAARAALDSARSSLQAVDSGRDPEFYAVGSSTGVSYEKDLLPGDVGWRVALEARWVLLDGNQTTHEVRRARARVLEAEANWREARDSVALEVRQAWLALQTAQRAWSAAQVEVERAREALAMAEGRYRSGVAVFLEGSQARVDLLAARANLLAARYDVQRARIRLDWAQGLEPPR